MVIQINVKQNNVNIELNQQHISCNGNKKEIKINYDVLQLPSSVVSNKSQYFLVAGIVVCLHLGLLFLILEENPNKKTLFSIPTITGQLIEIQPVKTIKLTKKEPVAIQKSTPIHTPKHAPAAIQPSPIIEKLITPEPDEKKKQASEDLEKEHVNNNVVEVYEKQTTIIMPSVNATRKSNPSPVYPRGSLRRKETGKVMLEIHIRVDGTVGDIRIKKSSGFKRLDRSAIKAVKRWRYTPARQNGNAIEYWYQQPITFSLRK